MKKHTEKKNEATRPMIKNALFPWICELTRGVLGVFLPFIQFPEIFTILNFFRWYKQGKASILLIIHSHIMSRREFIFILLL